MATSMYGAALVVVAVDYFVENFNMLHWFWIQLKEGQFTATTPPPTLCIISLVVVCLWPCLMVFGMVCQWCATGKGRHHEVIYNCHSRKLIALRNYRTTCARIAGTVSWICIELDATKFVKSSDRRSIAICIKSEPHMATSSAK